MRAIGYFRSGEDISGSPSLAEQEEDFSRFCRERQYQPLKTFTEADHPTFPGRSQYQRMLTYIRSNGKDATVVIRSLAHLHEDCQELLYRLIELDALGAQVSTMGEDIGSPLEAALQIWAAERQQHKRSDAISEAMKLRAVRGKGLGKPPYGYQLGPEKRLQVVQEEAEVVRLIYRLYLEKSMGVRLIARHLNEKGITTRRGGRWSIVGIRDILRNRTYLGTATRFGFRVPDSHRAIIDRNTFAKVQERLTSQPRHGERAPRSPFLLSGLAYCAYCNNRMIGVNRSQTWTTSRKAVKRKGRYRYYQCQSRTNQSVCQYHTKRADDLERAVLDTLLTYADTNAAAQVGVESSLSDDAMERTQLINQLKTLERKLVTQLEQAVDGNITLDELRLAAADLLWERRLLQQRLALVQAEGGATLEQRREYVTEMLRELRDRWDSMNPAQRKAFLAHLVYRVVVYDDHVETKIRL